MFSNEFFVIIEAQKDQDNEPINQEANWYIEKKGLPPFQEMLNVY